jgi:hypothetical protein
MRFATILALALVAAACAPKAPPLTGVPAPARLPRAELPAGHHRLFFRWSLSDPDIRLRGDGVAHIAPPDSVRLDFFLAGDRGGGRAILIDDDLRVPGLDLLGRYLPDPPLLWAALGRLAVPAAADTVARVDGDTLRADIGRGTRWRVAFAGGALRRLERIDGDELEETLFRDANGDVRYERPGARRRLVITVIGSERVTAFDEDLWK